MDINLKTLLLKGLSTDEAITFCYRVQIKRSRFVIRFEVVGKNLRLLHLKRLPPKKLSFKRRLRKRLRLMTQYRRSTRRMLGRRLRAKKFVDRSTTACPINRDKQIQVGSYAPQMCNQSSGTVNAKVKSSHQQTLCVPPFLLKRNVDKPQTMAPPSRTGPPCFRSTQTELQSENVGVQCKPLIVTRGTHSDEPFTTTIATQAGDGIIAYPQYDISNDTKAIVFLLNEVGEQVFKQSQILGNNHKLLHEITEMTALGNRNDLGHSWRQRGQRVHFSPKCSSGSQISPLPFANGTGDASPPRGDSPSKVLNASNSFSRLTQTDSPRQTTEKADTKAGTVKGKRVSDPKKQKH